LRWLPRMTPCPDWWIYPFSRSNTFTTRTRTCEKVQRLRGDVPRKV